MGGGDLIKDDHNLVDDDQKVFQERVQRCHEAVLRANDKTGRRALYLPNLMYPVDEIERRLEWIVGLGVPGVLVTPMVLGLDPIRRIAERYPVLIMAHPAFSGAYYDDPSHGIDPGLLLGKLFRLAGCDASVFPNHGGRFCLSGEACDGIRDGLRAPLGGLRAAWPVPAGGMNFERLPSMAAQYGPDSIFLIGGGFAFVFRRSGRQHGQVP